MKLKKTLANKVLITGATSGLGRALSFAFAERSIPLILSARSEIKLNQLRAELPSSSSVEIIPCDLSSESDRTRLIHAINALKPDLVINNAGFGLYGPALDHPIAEQLDIAVINAHVPLQLTLETANMFRAQGLQGTILNISSAAAFFSFPEFAVYSASKAFVKQFSTALDCELRAEGIRVLTACPGPFRTDFRNRASKGQNSGGDSKGMDVEKVVKEILQQIEKGTPLRIIDWKCRIGVCLAKMLIPRKWLESILRNSIRHLRHR